MMEVVNSNCYSYYPNSQNITSFNARSLGIDTYQVLPQVIQDVGIAAGLAICAHKGLFSSCSYVLGGSKFAATIVSDQTKSFVDLKPACSSVFSEMMEAQLEELTENYAYAPNKTDFILSLEKNIADYLKKLSDEDKEKLGQIALKLNNPEIVKSGYLGVTSRVISDVLKMPEKAINSLSNYKYYYSIGKMTLEKVSSLGLAILAITGIYRGAEGGERNNIAIAFDNGKIMAEIVVQTFFSMVTQNPFRNLALISMGNGVFKTLASIEDSLLNAPVQVDSEAAKVAINQKWLTKIKSETDESSPK